MKKSWLVMLVVLGVLLTACTMDADVTFYDDNTWAVEAQIEPGDVGDYVSAAQGLLTDVATDMSLPEEVLSLIQGFNQDKLATFVFRELVAHYGTRQIAVEWEIQRQGYKLSAKGRSWKSFEGLLPGNIQVDDSNPQQIKVSSYLGEENVWASGVFQQTIRVNGKEIFDSNAPIQEKNYAQWPNPRELNFTVVPKNRAPEVVEGVIDNPLPWAVGGSAGIAVLGFLVKIMRGGMFSKKQSADDPYGY